MNFFDFIKAKINRRKIKMLGSGDPIQTEKGDTQPIITIDTIEQILKNPAVFEDFLNPNTNKKFFNDGIEFKDYIQAVKDYVNFFIRNNVILSKDELKRAKIITGEKYKNAKPKKDYTLDEIAANLIYESNPNQYVHGNYNFNALSDFTEYMKDSTAIHSQNILINVCGKQLIYDEILKSILTINSRINAQCSVLDLDIDRKVMIDSLLVMANKKEVPIQSIQVRRKIKPEEYSLNPDFEKMITSKISNKTRNKGDLAYQIYKAVFSSVQYDTGYFIKKNDELSEEFVQQILNKSINDIDDKNDRITCITGSQLFCYFLNKYGIDASIIETTSVNNKNKNVRHCSVEIYLDDDTIIADATNGTNNNNMTDMSRIKLGLKPANFKSVKNRDYSYNEQTDENSPGYFLQKDVDSIKQMISSEGFERDVTIDEKVEILKKQLQKISGTNIGNYATTQYMRALFAKLFSGGNVREKGMGITSSLYTKDAEDVFSFFTIIYLKASENQYRYYCYDENNGLKEISLENIQERISKHELYVQKGKEGHVPGLESEKTVDNEHDYDEK